MGRSERGRVRRGVRRAVGRALLVTGGAIGGTLVGWLVAAGTAQADTPSPHDTTHSVIDDHGEHAADIGRTLVHPARGAVGSLAGSLTSPGDHASASPAESTSDTGPLAGVQGGLHRLTTPVRGVVGALSAAPGTDLTGAPGRLAGELTGPGRSGGAHIPAKHPVVRQSPATPLASPRPVAPESDGSRADGSAVPKHHAWSHRHQVGSAHRAGEPSAPLLPFDPPSVPGPSAASGQDGAGNAGNTSAAPQLSLLYVTYPPAGAFAPADTSHRAWARTDQPGVTPD